MTTPGRGLSRELGLWDAALITIGSVLGGGIFITTGDMARSLPHAGLILLVWLVGGLLTLAGALTYAELGAMFPRAGGQYEFLKETYGRLWGFLFGWAAFFVIMTGGIAALAVSFGEYLGAFIPFFSTGHVLFAIPLGTSTQWMVNGGQLAGALVIVFLTFINYLGVREGAGLQNLATIAKVGSLLSLGVLGLLMTPNVSAASQIAAPLPEGSRLIAAFGIGMMAALWSYDGWYAISNLAGEMRNPARDLPLGIVAGTVAITLLYLLVNLAYVRTLTVEEMAATSRIGETAAQSLFGPLGGRLLTAAVLVSIFGCISATVLWSARIYLPMAQDGSFFPSLARIHPRYATPAACLVAQGVWATLLTFSGSYEQLYTYVIFAVVFFHAATGTAVFVLRRTRPDAPRPYSTWGYPWVPAIFVLSSLGLCANTLIERPVESLVGVLFLVLGLPAYAFWQRRAKKTQGPGAPAVF